MSSENLKSQEGQAEKRLNFDLKPENDQKKSEIDKDIEIKIVSDSILEKQAPEMLMEIFKNLDHKELFASRLLSRRLNEAISAVLMSKPHLYTKFNFEEAAGNEKTAIKWIGGGGKTLADFVNCFLASKHFPFTRFQFGSMLKSTFAHPDWIQFISKLGKTVKSLLLEINLGAWNKKSDGFVIDDVTITLMMSQISATIAELLLTQLPKLEEFGLSLEYRLLGDVSASSKLRLFQKSEVEDRNLDSGEEKAQSSSTSTVFKKPVLPLLKTVHLDEVFVFKYRGIVTDLLLAAPNLQKIVYNNNKTVWKYETLENFLFLQQLGKLGCLQILKLKPTCELLLKINGDSNAIPKFKLNTLKLCLQQIYDSHDDAPEENLGIFANTPLLLFTIFESSKDTLRELTTEAFGFLENLQIPVFSKLIKLTVQEKWDEVDDTIQERLLPPEVKLGDTFPVLQSLVLGLPWNTAFPHDNVTSVSIPTLAHLKILGVGVTGNIVAKISTLCPNLKVFKICQSGGEAIENFPDVSTAIWTLMNQLESLELRIEAHPPANAFPVFDYTFIAFSRDCEGLYDLMKADKLLENQGRGSQVKVQSPGSKFTAERINPSILDVKNLKWLKIRRFNCYYGGVGDPRPDHKLIQKTITGVSKECAIKVMDQLLYKIEALFTTYWPDSNESK